jgi:hypothetical protein
MISVLSHSTPQVAGFFVTEGVNAWIQFGTFYQDWAKRGLTHIAVKAIPVSGKVGNACEMYISPSKKLFDERTTSLDKP